MFKVNDYVVKANHGVCQIIDIVHLDMPSIDKKREYFFLVPIDDRSMKVYVPVDMAEQNLRYAMDDKQALQCIESMKSIDSAWIKNDKQREAFYRDALKSCDPTQLIAIIKNMFERKQDRLASGKSAIVVDDKYFKLAEEQLYSELAFALGMKKEEMLSFIQMKIE